MAAQPPTSFSIATLSVLDPQGNAKEGLLPKLAPQQFLDMYAHMVLLRVFDDKALKLQRQGRIGTYASSLGQEACTIGSAHALEKGDWTVPAFREHGVFRDRRLPRPFRSSSCAACLW